MPPTIRLKAPREGDTVVDDLVQGPVRVANTELDDMIILRSDGTPTYLHAVVVDDHDMGITHVIRGDDHLTNTFRQVQVYHAMGWDLPRFAHLPLIHGADGAKLSKRHGAVSVLEFREHGFLPEALCNYLLRLGWGHGDVEALDRAEAIRLFDIDGVGRAAARMDYAKLIHLNGIYIRQADDERLTQDVVERLKNRPGLIVDEAAVIRIRALMPGLKERAKTLVELADSAAFLALRAPVPLDGKAAGTPHARCACDVARAERSAAADRILKGNNRRHPARFRRASWPQARPGGAAAACALTGSTVSPGIDAVLAALGREESLDRIRAVAA